MCKNESCCLKPEKLKGKPEECTPEQIAECHSDEEGHPCEEGKKDKQLCASEFSSLLVIQGLLIDLKNFLKGRILALPFFFDTSTYSMCLFQKKV